MKKTVLILSGLWLLAACGPAEREGVQRYEDFPETRVLEAETLPLDTAVFRYPYRVRVQGDKAVVLDLHGTNHYLQAFTYPDFRYLASAGRRGEAPEEVLSVENIRWDGASLWMLDANKAKLTRLGFADNGLVQQEAVALDDSLLRALDFVQYDDSTFIIPDYSGESRLCWVDRQGRLLRKSGQIPVAEEYEGVRPALAQAWRSFLDYNPRNGVLAAATQLGEVLEVWNLHDNTHTVCTGPCGEPEFQVSDGYGIPTGVMGFGDVQVGDHAIYALFSGASFRDIIRSAQQGEELPDGCPYLYVFTLEGKPLMKYKLDHPVCGFCVDEAGQLIIAADVNQDEPMLRFRMDVGQE